MLDVYDACVFGLGPFTQRRDREVNSTVFQTMYQREGYALPAHFVVLWDDSGGCQCLDLRRVRSGDCPVVIYDRTAKGAKRERVIAPTFGAWLRLFVAKQLETKRMLDIEMPGKLTPMGGIRTRKRRAKVAKKTKKATKKR